ncbi:MAG: bifunctional proline dehydrogenase/L-glutamate gamma-semialdehyde dehydrogenase PutA [Gammaproteobacteria bacterium]|nr:bifunctional proline dehydrogenase/L-glutamate gamma-semialdehyde dehydrogenase PutA [Gammaproteobacteria bacterium]
MQTRVSSAPGGEPELIFPADSRREGIAGLNRLYLADEATCIEALIPSARLPDEARFRVRAMARKLVESVRRNRVSKGGIDAFLQEYDLSSQEGVVLMCLAEALLRIPDDDTANRLIQDKLAEGKWSEHLDADHPLFVNASTWGLMLTGRIIVPGREAEEDPASFMRRLVARAGEPVIRGALRQAMRIMGHQYVMGSTISAALKRAGKGENRAYRYSFDMLGEAAMTQDDARRYQRSYADAISAIGKEAGDASVFAAPSISVKLSALHPRYEFSQRERVLAELIPVVAALAEQAAQAGIALTMDAEEADRLELSLEVFAGVLRTARIGDWNGFGLAVQTYLKQAPAVVEWLIHLADETGRRIPVRLVKGAYWDTEIKHAQEQGLEGYPVFTRKASTDVSFLACARRVLEAGDKLYPQFATHNARTVATIIEFAGAGKEYEFQRLHGMGEELYAEVIGDDGLNIPCRVYAPVGNHKDLLPYLVRRLLENGANTSFVNRITDDSVPVDEIIRNPVSIIEATEPKAHPKIPLPADIFQPERINSQGLNIYDTDQLRGLADAMSDALEKSWKAMPVVGGKALAGKPRDVTDPGDHRRIVGVVEWANAEMVDNAISIAAAAQPGWDRMPAASRATILEKAASLFEENRANLMALCVREAGKSVVDALSELREAVDFLRYYAAGARADFAAPLRLPGPTGESNELALGGRGVFVCISPWNFPLAIFTGQVAAALAAGNSVIAKPAEQTPLVAHLAVRLLLEAGVPGDVLHFLPGDGASVGARAVANEGISGVAFTGSTETAQLINRSLAAREGSIATLIAETGGQNVMLVDSSALPEQVVADVVQSAFNSAGQRCSALRVLCVQEEIAPKLLELLAGHMEELVIGDPGLLNTDVGPVIDAEALQVLERHEAAISELGKVVKKLTVPPRFASGTYFGPLAVEISDLNVLKREVFGPVLHILRYRSDELESLLQKINAMGYGLTLGVHSRIDHMARWIHRRVKVGNAYVNRNMVGAVVGVQPFGGCGLSGTGPKAGGPHYLHRFATERTLTINTAAVGGNASLLSLDGE